jgi:hypothetical protein
MNKFKYGQDVMNPETTSGRAMAGFNRKVSGWTYLECFDGWAKTCDETHAGWNLAEEMINKGKLFYVYNFHKLDCEDGFAFQYGGYWVCNTCGNKSVDRDWWTIKVFKDGDAWCCIGLDFENLQESDNYAFGESREEAINSYGEAMASREAIKQAEAE